MALLEKWIQSVKNRWVADIGVLKKCPLTIADGLDKHGVDPLEARGASLANLNKRLELVENRRMSL